MLHVNSAHMHNLNMLNLQARRRMDEAAVELKCPALAQCKVVASNDIQV
jgi:hypothetical protein